jgi:uncharacterized membrane protein YfcA
LTEADLVGVIGIAFLAAGCQSLTGFGSSLLAVPLLSLYLDAKQAVVIATFLSTVISAPLLLEVRRQVRVAKVAPLAIGSVVGLPLGILILRNVDAGALKVLVAAVVILASALLFLAPRLTLGGRNTLSSLITGAFSGLLRASTSMAGPPVVLYTLSHERDIEEFRSTVLALFLITGLLAIPGLVVADLISRDAVIATAVAIPGMALGLLVGTRLRSRVQPTSFRTLVLAVLVITSIGVIVSASGVLG